MPLKTVRDLFVEVSGRRDLVNDDGSDNGANFYLNAGQKLLDPRIEMPMQRHGVKLPAGGWHVHVLDLRELHEVWAVSTEGRRQLERKEYQKLWRWLAPLATDTSLEPPVKVLASATGCPRFYAALPIHVAPHQDIEFSADPFGHRLGMDGALFGDSDRWRGVMVWPPTDQDIGLHIVGRFFSPKLEQDTDQSWWTENHPQILVRAALWQLEANYRNTEGQQDMLRAIDVELTGIDHSMATESATDAMRIEG